MKKLRKTMMMFAVFALAAMCSCTKDNGNSGDNSGNNGDGANGREYVDLGLPSGTLWATCNVGANSPEEYGDYFAWAETQSKVTYTWGTYQYCNGGSHSLTKYCNDASYGQDSFVDFLTTLQSVDDAAASRWGGKWRTPTRSEWEELVSRCTRTWTTQNGVKGSLFVAPNGNSIFLPANGFGYDYGYDFVGSSGRYWSNSLIFSYPYRAWYFAFSSNSCGMDEFGDRYYGQAVRPVLSSSKE